MILHFEQLNSPFVEHILEGKVFFNQFQFLILAHLLYLNTFHLNIVGLL